MLDINQQKITGFVMPIGGGAVGKTSLALTLEKQTLPPGWEDTIQNTHKTYNLEFCYIQDQIYVNEKRYAVLHQYLVPPGQKSIEITQKGRSFEDVIDIYRELIRRVDVILLSYKINDLDSYNSIEYWVEIVNGIVNDQTNFILVGTHLDKVKDREVTEEMVKSGILYVTSLIKNIRPTWKGYITSMEVSNISGENIDKLRKLISGFIILAAGIQVKTVKE
jgi:GTPase SAR1 family protein